MNLDNLSHDTLVGIVEDFDLSNTYLKSENERLTTDLAKKQENVQHDEGTDSGWKLWLREQDKERGKHNVLKSMIDNTTKLSDAQAIVVFGIVAEAGGKFMAIKTYGQRFNAGLKESREAIEQWREPGMLK